MPGGKMKRKKSGGGLLITSLMDIMTVMLIFLLKVFSAEGQILTNADNLVLPNSVSTEGPKDVRLQLALTNDWIMVDNIPVVRTPTVLKQEGMTIQAVKDKLAIAMAQEEMMVKIGALLKVKGELIIQADKNIEYDVIYKVMATCGEVGYNAIKFAVMGKEE